MSFLKWKPAACLTLICCGIVAAQQAEPAQKIHPPDERYKADILVVVAHPDDEGAATPYLARAIYDLHKRVAVVYGTRGGSGANEESREHGPALAVTREIEAREACAKMGIRDVWFLNGQDTASQNVLNSLANWGHGESLEQLVRIVRVTRPEVVLTWLPSIFIGENHGDHQAAGVLATEAFDLAGDPVAFPSQVAGASKRLEPYLENLTPWQPKKIYYFSDADDNKQFAGSGPSYSVREISPSMHKPYWRLAFDAFTPHRTQYPGMIDAFSKMGDEQLTKAMENSDSAWSEPLTLTYGKSLVGGKVTDDVFSFPKTVEAGGGKASAATGGSESAMLQIGGPWGFYNAFRVEHGITQIPVAKTPEIGVKAGSTVYVPLIVEHRDGKTMDATVRVTAPEGWKVTSGAGAVELPAEASTTLRVELQTPELDKKALKTQKPEEVSVRAEVNGKPIGEVTLRVLLRGSGLPQ